MSRFKNWMQYTTPDGTFALPRYLFESNQDLMKQCLDFGVMAVEKPDKLRAYKEAVKAAFKKRWNDLAEALEYYGIVEPCGCRPGEFCTICGGSRYQLNGSLNPDQVREVATFIAKDADPSVVLEKLQGAQ